MKVAVTYENGRVFQHFGKTQMFLLADVDHGTIREEQLCSSEGKGHGALAGVLKQWNVETLICGGIGQGAIQALREQGIAIVRGVDMDAHAALVAFANQTLKDDPNKQCTHHAQEAGHHCADHSCTK